MVNSPYFIKFQSSTYVSVSFYIHMAAQLPKDPNFKVWFKSRLLTFPHRVCPKHRIFGRQESRRHIPFNIERCVPPALRTYVPRNSQETVLFYQGEGLPLYENDERRCWSRTTRWIEIPICSERESTFHKSFAVNCFNSCLSNDFELRSFCAVQMSLVRIRGIGIT